MLNFALMKEWENWFIVFLMFSIAMLGMHIFIDFIDYEEN